MLQEIRDTPEGASNSREHYGRPALKQKVSC